MQNDPAINCDSNLHLLSVFNAIVGLICFFMAQKFEDHACAVSLSLHGLFLSICSLQFDYSAKESSARQPPSALTKSQIAFNCLPFISGLVSASTFIFRHQSEFATSFSLCFIWMTFCSYLFSLPCCSVGRPSPASETRVRPATPLGVLSV